MKKKKYVVHVGVSGFPFGSAAINKCLTVYNILNNIGYNVLIINNRAVHSKSIPQKIEKRGLYNKLEYVYTTPTSYRPNKFFLRRYYNFVGRLNEFRLLLLLSIKKQINVLIYYPHGFFFELIFYRILSLIFNYPIISHYVEYRTSFVSRKKNLKLKFYDILFDKYFMKFVDGIMPISEFLINHIKNKGFRGSILKIPPLVDFNLFNKKVSSSEKYFLYVGSYGYYQAIDIVINAFELLNQNEYFLYLVINGTHGDINKLKNNISELKSSKKIKIFSKLDYCQLINLYLGAKALLLPLSNSVQDKARFPHKISEYTASRNPIITNNNGEIQYYFKDKESALIAKSYNSFHFSKEMKYILENEKFAEQIGLNGYKIGLKYFNSNSYTKRMNKFINSVINN